MRGEEGDIGKKRKVNKKRLIDKTRRERSK